MTIFISGFVISVLIMAIVLWLVGWRPEQDTPWKVATAFTVSIFVTYILVPLVFA